MSCPWCGPAEAVAGFIHRPDFRCHPQSTWQLSPDAAGRPGRKVPDMAENRWDIQEEGTRSLLRDCQDLVARCEPAKDAAQAALNALETALASCPELADAVDRLRFDVIANDMTDIMVRCNNAIQGTRESVDAYAAGDRDMAHSARNAASAARDVAVPVGTGRRWMAR